MQMTNEKNRSKDSRESEKDKETKLKHRKQEHVRVKVD